MQTVQDKFPVLADSSTISLIVLLVIKDQEIVKTEIGWLTIHRIWVDGLALERIAILLLEEVIE